LRQRFAYLAVIYSTGMEGQASVWFADPDECKWRGIQCSNGKVISFSRSGLGQGTIPDDVGLWTDLTRFNVGLNSFVGTLPSSIGAWSKLEYFNVANSGELGNNQLTGTVPKEVSAWKPIKQAYFEGNKFNGTMPVVGDNFCPKNNTNLGDLWADCKPPAEIVCGCCNGCL
jgi:hypothetical protein